MTVSPYFVADQATLKSLLRLTGAASPDLASILDEATRQAMQDMYRRLGASRLAEIKSTGFVDSPATEAQFVRSVANSTEVLIVKLHLLDSLPIRFLDGTGDAHQTWNDEAPFRDLSAEAKEKEIERLTAQIESNFGMLEGDEDIGEPSVQGFLLEPDTAPPPMGNSLWGTASNQTALPDEEGA